MTWQCSVGSCANKACERGVSLMAYSRRMKLALQLSVLFVVSLLAARGAGALEPGGTARIRSVVDGDTVVLDDAAEVRLVGIQAPKLPLGRPGFPEWPLAEEAKVALEQLAQGKEVALLYGGARVDRHGRRLAHLQTVGTDEWVQGEMLRRGLARVYTFADNRSRAAEMLALEREARSKRRGIWANDFYRILSPDEAGRHIDSFQLIEGKVVATAEVKGRVYLNFGPDWRTDFTVSVSPQAMRLFRAAQVDLRGLEQRQVRVRGWLSLRNGPAIEASHPEQIEALD